MGIHVYVVKGWTFFSVLLTLEQILTRGTIDNLARTIVANVLQIKGLSESNLVSNFINFGVDVVSFSKVLKQGL
jgi:hypothetical protein